MRQRALASPAMSTVLSAGDHPAGTVLTAWRMKWMESVSLPALMEWSMTQLRSSVS